MIFGVGTDIFCISRIRPLMQFPDDAFFKKAFTLNERAQAYHRPDPIYYFSTRFAGKEAIYKAISRCGCDFRPGEIEILDSAEGKPEAVILGQTLHALENCSPLTIFLSLSWDGDYASAFALVEIKQKGKML
jgi:holo-[acyl-carrier protein] synthase